MAKRKGLGYQVMEFLGSLRAYGHSKYLDKKLNHGKPATDKIYSYATYRTYFVVCMNYVDWLRGRYRCLYIDDARQYVPEYLQWRIDQHLSAHTIKKEASALAKLYQCSYLDFGVDLPKRHRADRVLHRNADRAEEYAKQYPELAEYCKATGLRRSEIRELKIGDTYRDASGQVIVHVAQGKGGRERYVVALSDVALQMEEDAAAAGRERVFSKLPSRATIHMWRQEYARRVYAIFARPLEQIPRKERYYCRAELKGTVFDKRAMKTVSLMLGHSRLGVVVSYLA